MQKTSANNTPFCTLNKWGDKLQNSDFAKNHLIIGPDHKINDLRF